MMKKVNILRMDKHGTKKMEDWVVEEKNIRIFLNDNFVDEISCIPKDVEYLVLGHLYCKGLVDSKIEMKIHFPTMKVKLSNNAPKIKDKTHELPSIKSIIDVETISKAMETLLRSSELFLKTGGCHMAGIFDLERKKYDYLCEDVSRRSAVEKCIGYVVSNSNENRAYALLLTGRVNGEIVQHCAQAGIAVVITKAAVSDEAIEKSKENHITLIGFAREKRANVYSNFERIDFENSCEEPF